ncbi:hypothetical protein [Jeotgalibacillus aurantiacus]|uniref:hypothetical protein n=1 Tax=Jeotgalibacillus aurantiacus TaxID=2763266 RepID=UPI001D0A4A6E|nr:hypothetical protein [Jeotgalibacillus aurantiacus]
MVIQECHQITNRLFILLQSDEAVDRDKLITQINHLLDEREKLLPNVCAPETDYERELADEIIKWNQVIEKKLTDIKNDVRKKILLTAEKKKSSNKYTNPYGEMESKDGMFYDKRN